MGSSDPVEDENVMLCPGVRSTEHRGEKDPFDPSGHDTHMRSTHAGSISYIFGQSYIVVCEMSETASDGLLQVACRNLAGSELGVVNIQSSEDTFTLREKVSTLLGAQSASVHLELMTPSGTLLKDGQSMEDGLVHDLSR